VTNQAGGNFFSVFKCVILQSGTSRMGKIFLFLNKWISFHAKAHAFSFERFVKEIN